MNKSTDTVLMFPGIYPISRCDLEVQVATKALLLRLHLLDTVWPTRNRIDHVFYNQITRKIWVRETNKLYRVGDSNKAIHRLEKHGLTTEDCFKRAMFEAPHYRAITIDMRSPTDWRRRVYTNRPPRAGYTRIVVYVEPTRPIAPQLASYMAAI